MVSAHGWPATQWGRCWPPGDGLCSSSPGGAGGAGSPGAAAWPGGDWQLDCRSGEALSYPEERIVEAQVWELAEQEFSTLSVLLVDGAAPVWPVRSQGIDDGAFLRGEVPMTKQEVRAAALAKLEVRDGAVYWDVGAGTGSVSVELALLGPQEPGIRRGVQGGGLRPDPG